MSVCSKCAKNVPRSGAQKKRIFDHSLIDFFTTGRQSSSSALCTRVALWLGESGIDFGQVAKKRPESLEPWRQVSPHCNSELMRYGKAQTLPTEFAQLAAEEISSYRGYTKFYTDGSKGPAGAGCAFTGDAVRRCFGLPSVVSVFTTELYAILQVLRYISRRPTGRHLIITDSASSLAALRSGRAHASWLVSAILKLLTTLSARGAETRFLWVPSHVGISGNEAADEAAKIAASLAPPPRFKVPPADIKVLINQSLQSEWQTRWEAEPDCFLKHLRPTVDRWESSSRRNRREEVCLTRLRIGHTYITHGHYLSQSDPNTCPKCGERLTVKHVLSETAVCAGLRTVRNRFLRGLSVSDILGNNSTVDFKRVLTYLTEIGFDIIYNPRRT